MKIVNYIGIGLISLLIVSCGKRSEVDGVVSQKAKPVEVVQTITTNQVATNEEVADTTHWDQVTRLYEKAKASGETSARSASEWMGEMFDKVKDVGTGASKDTKEWVEDAYEYAKERGETSAASAKDWVKSDLGKNGAWEYKTIVMSIEDPIAIEGELNGLGAERWECFWVDRQADRATFYLKKPGRSYLRNLPARELLKLLPLVGGVGDSGE